jgi:hypothetical protein
MSLENGTRRCVRIILLVTLLESECTDQVAISSVGQRVPSIELQTTRFTYVVPGLYRCYPQRRREQDISCTLEPHNIASVHPLGDAKPIKLSALRRGDKDMTKHASDEDACSLLCPACAEPRWKCTQVSLLLVKSISSHGSCSYSFHERGVFPCRLEL